MWKFDVVELKDKLGDKVVSDFFLVGTTFPRRLILTVKFLFYVIGLLFLTLIEHVRGTTIHTESNFRPVRIPFEKRLTKEYIYFLHDFLMLLFLSFELLMEGKWTRTVFLYVVMMRVTLSDWCSALCGVYYEFVPPTK